MAAGIIADKLIEKVEYGHLTAIQQIAEGGMPNILPAAALTWWIGAILARRRRAW